MSCKHHHNCEKAAKLTAEQLCETYGFRFTESRKQVFEALISSHKALTAKELMIQIGNNQPPITYRALEFLTEAGLVHFISSINAYIACAHAEDEGHISQFLICKECHEVEEFQAPDAVALLTQSAKDGNFQVSDTSIEMLGVCSECQS